MSHRTLWRWCWRSRRLLWPWSSLAPVNPLCPECVCTCCRHIVLFELCSILVTCTIPGYKIASRGLGASLLRLCCAIFVSIVSLSSVQKTFRHGCIRRNAKLHVLWTLYFAHRSENNVVVLLKTIKMRAAVAAVAAAVAMCCSLFQLSSLLWHFPSHFYSVLR